MNWSIPDVLRINDFSIEVKLTVQQFSDQEKNRLWWWNKYDLPHFKEVLLKEAAARPEGLPLGTVLLLRCRDYFEIWADEVLAKVGISDVDRYLAALELIFLPFLSQVWIQGPLREVKVSPATPMTSPTVVALRSLYFLPSAS